MHVETHHFADDGVIPNSPFPLMIYRAALTGESDLAAAFERRFASNDWRRAWRNGIFAYHHFHSTSHEVLGIASGEATVRFGGEHGARLALRTGDVLVVPAGVGHRLEHELAELLVVGAYPAGRAWDIRRGNPSEREEVLVNLAAVPLPGADPVQGSDGPLPGIWLATLADR